MGGRSGFDWRWGTIAVLTGSLVSIMVVVGAAGASLDKTPVAVQGHSWAGLEIRDAVTSDVWGAFGSWVVPTLSCDGSGDTYLTTWVGIGGALDGDTLYQTGIETNCHNGHQVSWAFKEAFAGGTNNLSPKCLGENNTFKECYAVDPGDAITADVVNEPGEFAAGSNSDVTFYSISDTHDGVMNWSSSDDWRTGSEHSHTAECVVEDPLSDSGVTHQPMAQFNDVTFTSCETSDQDGLLHDMNPAAQPKLWSRQILNMKSASGSSLTNTELTPLRVTLKSSTQSLPATAWTPLQGTTIGPTDASGVFTATFNGTFWGGIYAKTSAGCDYRFEGEALLESSGSGYGFGVRAMIDSSGVPHSEGIQYDAGIGGYRDTLLPDDSETGTVQTQTLDNNWHKVSVEVIGNRYQSSVDGTVRFSGTTPLTTCGGVFIRVWRSTVELKDLSVTPITQFTAQ